MLRLLLSCLFAVSLGATSLAQAPQPPSAAQAALREGMKPFIAEGEVSGIVSVVGRSSGIIAVDASGYRQHQETQLGKGEPAADSNLTMQPDTLFRIASMTKPITAIGIMILAEEGKLNLNDPVEKHLPEFQGQMIVAERQPSQTVLKKPSRPITIRDLLTHTSGLPGGYPQGIANIYARRHLTLAESIFALSQRPLEFEPGSKWAYCNAGIDTLGRIIEVISGKSYPEFLHERVFAPLKMQNTTFYPTAEQIQKAATLYDRKGDGPLSAVPAPFIGNAPPGKHPIPAGGLWSCGPDLARLYRMMLNKGELDGVRILSEPSVKEMTRVQTGDLKCGFVEGMGFGYGWAVVKKPEGVTAMLSSGTYGHGGAFGTQGWIDPEKDLFVILMIQRTGLRNADASPMRQKLQEIAVKLTDK